MADRLIQSADLSKIERNIQLIHSNIQALENDMSVVNNNMQVVYNEISALANVFHDFAYQQRVDNRTVQAETRIVKIRQEIDDQFGHYDIVRRTTTGILQATDIGIIKKTTLSNATEELMISTPGYWLAPCLVALSSWICDKRELAERALKEGIRRNDEKTSLFFGLICMRANRKGACLKWFQRYLENQDEEHLDRKTIIVLDAFVNGLLGADTDGIISKQMTEWLEHLANKPGFVEKQKKQWTDAINLKRKPINTNNYTYLPKYSSTWPQMADVLEGTYLHDEIYNYFTNIFDLESYAEPIKTQLDDILTSLVTDYDDEELPLRKKERFEQLVVEYNGDEAKARQAMEVEETAFETHTDFTQLLTDIAMKPEIANASVASQKFAIAFSKEWILEAYNDVIAANRIKIPATIEISVDNFNDKTSDGSDEDEIINRYTDMINNEREEELKTNTLSTYDMFLKYGGIGVILMGVLMIFGSPLMGIVVMIFGTTMVLSHRGKKQAIVTNTETINKKYDDRLERGTQIIRAIIAEIVDYRLEFAEREKNSEKVIDFLEQISPEQYVKNMNTTRKIKL